jgi:transposase
VKAFIASHGGRAKTDPIDAAWLGRYGLERLAGLTPWRPPEPEREAFAELLRHRQDLLVQRTGPRTAAAHPAGHACTSCSTSRSPSSPPRSAASTRR